MGRFRFFTADVFTDQVFGGNPLAVVPDARGLDARRMQQIAREFDYSETTFVLPPDDSRHTRRVRIFTPAAEIPFAGHPTIGTAYVLAAIGEIPLAADETRIVLEEGVGPVPITIRAESGRPVFTELTAARLPEIGPAPVADGDIASLLRLRPEDLADADWRPAIASCGFPFVMVPVRSIDAVARAAIDRGRFAALAPDFPGVYVFTLSTALADADVHARMFAPAFGVEEDPATGSAAAALAGYLAARVSPGAPLRWTIDQGSEMGRPSRIFVEADGAGGVLTAVRVGGASVMVSEGNMEVP
jgi:trans-2,3-dihydro-3-hydroxyanthranilate isomerase